MKKSVAIIGGGPAAFLLAAFLDPQQFFVTIYEKNKTLGRKFLVAGKGGFNLTHSEPISQLMERYTPAHFLQQALLDFDNEDFQLWIASMGIPTFIGSSSRVYPDSGIKPIAVLNAILAVLKKRDVAIEFESNWNGWDTTNNLIFNQDKVVEADYTIFALGGGSWKVTGSDGSWLQHFKQKGIAVVPFKASNCAYEVNWPKEFINTFKGTPLKNIAISCGKQQQKGELVITRFGLEGNAIYAISPAIRTELALNKVAIVYIDLKPSITYTELLKKIQKSSIKKTSEKLQKELKLTTAQIGLLKIFLSKETYLDSEQLAKNIKRLPIKIEGAALLDEAISTIGGIPLNALTANFELKEIKNTYCIGEMLDLDAPTGGYLLQSCFSMGVFLARHLNVIEK